VFTPVLKKEDYMDQRYYDQATLQRKKQNPYSQRAARLPTMLVTPPCNDALSGRVERVHTPTAATI
jgi:hypothetical protein